MDEIEFRASFPPIQSAIKRSGAGDGLRIQLDIPESDVPEAVALMALTQERLLVRISVIREDDDKEKRRKTKF